eukprot:394649_1
MNNMFTPAKHEKQSQKAKTYIQNSHILLFYITITCITSISTLEIILNCFAMDSITYYVRTNNIYGAHETHHRKNKLFPLQFALNKSDIILKNKTKENNLLLNSIKEMK